MPPRNWGYFFAQNLTESELAGGSTIYRRADHAGKILEEGWINSGEILSRPFLRGVIKYKYKEKRKPMIIKLLKKFKLPIYVLGIIGLTIINVILYGYLINEYIKL